MLENISTADPDSRNGMELLGNAGISLNCYQLGNPTAEKSVLKYPLRGTFKDFCFCTEAETFV